MSVGESRVRPALAGLGEVAGWAVVACGVWLATLSGVTLPELCFAILVSVPCGVMARLGRRALGGSWRFRPRWVLWAVPAAGAVLTQSGQLLRLALAGPREGELRQIALPDEPVELANGREALGTLALCATPGTLVADCDADRHVLTVHALVAGGPDLEERIRR